MTNILQQLGVKGTETIKSFGLSPISSHSMLGAMRAATRIIAHFFAPIRALASKPTFTLVPYNQGQGKVVITLLYYIPNRQEALSNTTINSLGEVLSRLFGRPVELRLTRVHYPYMNSYILAQYVAINTTRYNFTRIQRALFTAVQVVNQRMLTASSITPSSLPAYIIGVKIRISGRLDNQRSVPRQTVQEAQVGSFTDIGNQKVVIDAGSFTSTNKKGAFTVKVWISQLPLTS